MERLKSSTGSIREPTWNDATTSGARQERHTKHTRTKHIDYLKNYTSGNQTRTTPKKDFRTTQELQQQKQTETRLESLVQALTRNHPTVSLEQFRNHKGNNREPEKNDRPGTPQELRKNQTTTTKQLHARRAREPFRDYGKNKTNKNHT